jgi:hypothetical protein
VRVIYESKWWIEVDIGEYRHYGCRSRSSRCGERHGWMIRKSHGRVTGTSFFCDPTYFLLQSLTNCRSSNTR